MNYHTSKKLILALLITLHTPCIYTAFRVTTYISPRSQTTQGARLTGYFQHMLNTTDNRSIPRYETDISICSTRSFWSDCLNECLFGSCCGNNGTTFAVSGSTAANRNQNDWLADYFFLPTDFKSIIATRPRVKEDAVTIQGYISLDPIHPKLYAKIHLPIVHTNWWVTLHEKIINAGTTGYNAGYFSPEAINAKNLASCFCSFMSGCTPPELPSVTVQPLQNSKIHPCSLHKAGIAELQTTLGYIAHHDIGSYLDYFFTFNIPGGNKPQGEFLFEPIIGNGHHAEVGAGASGYWQPWLHTDPTHTLIFYGNFHISHLFKTRQTRNFDLINKPLSRYMLAVRMQPTIENNLLGQQNNILTTPDAQFAAEYAPVANLTTIPLDVYAAFQTELTLMLAYTEKNWSWLWGYNLWARSADIFSCCSPSRLATETWALKGDSQMFGFAGNSPTALSATQTKKATINAGANFGITGAQNTQQLQAGQQNPHIDNPQPAAIDNGVVTPLTALPNGDPITNRVNTSINPIILTPSDIDYNSARTKSLSHTLFVQIQRTWKVKSPWVPILALGGQIEFGPTGRYSLYKNDIKSIHATLSQWGVWTRIGFAYI